MNMSLNIFYFLIAGAIKSISMLTTNASIHKQDDLRTTVILAGVGNKCILIREGHQEIDEEIDNRFIHLFVSTPFFMYRFAASLLQSLERLRYSTLLENCSVALA